MAYRCVRLASSRAVWKAFLPKACCFIRALFAKHLLYVHMLQLARIVQPKQCKPTVTHQPWEACKLPQGCDAPERRYRKFALGSDVELVCGVSWTAS